jgi:hypothetical protein
MKLKNLILISFFCFASFNSYSQANQSNKQNATNPETNRFYYFEIPSAINGSNIDPSAISNVTSNFTDSKLSIKLGFPNVIKKAPEEKDLIHTGFFQVYAKATNGVATLWKSSSPPMEFGVTGGYSLKLKHLFWVYLDVEGNQTERHSSEAFTWLNFICNIERGNYNIFNNSIVYDNILDKKIEVNGSFYVSINHYFFSKINKHRWKSVITSLGLGFARTNNNNLLKSRTYQTGQLVYNADSTKYQTVVESTSGRLGEFIIYNGFSAFYELYIPIIRSPKYGSIYIGNRLTFYGNTNKLFILNENTGLYFNVKDQKTDGDKPAKDVINFSVTAQFNQINNAKNSNYIKDNFTVQVQAAVPLRFN